MKRPSSWRPVLTAIATIVVVVVVVVASAAHATAGGAPPADFAGHLAQNRSVLDGALRGALIGGIAGAIVGLIIWLFKKSRGGPGGPTR